MLWLRSVVRIVKGGCTSKNQDDQTIQADEPSDCPARIEPRRHL